MEATSKWQRDSAVSYYMHLTQCATAQSLDTPKIGLTVIWNFYKETTKMNCLKDKIPTL